MDREFLEKYILEKSEIFKMKGICDMAGIKYNSFKGWKYSGRPISTDRLKKLYDAMHNCLDDDNQHRESIVIDINDFPSLNGVSLIPTETLELLIKQIR